MIIHKFIIVTNQRQLIDSKTLNHLLLLDYVKNSELTLFWQIHSHYYIFNLLSPNN